MVGNNIKFNPTTNEWYYPYNNDVLVKYNLLPIELYILHRRIQLNYLMKDRQICKKYIASKQIQSNVSQLTV